MSFLSSLEKTLKNNKTKTASNNPRYTTSISPEQQKKNNDIFLKELKGKDGAWAAATAYLVKGAFGSKEKYMNPEALAVINANPKLKSAANVAEVVGTMAQFAVPYGAATKAITSIPKIAKAGELIGKALTKTPLLEKTAMTLGGKIAGSVATDLAVGVPLNVNYALNTQDLKGKEAVKSILTNTGLDLVTGGLMEAVPAVYKGIKGIGGTKVLNVEKSIPNVPKSDNGFPKDLEAKLQKQDEWLKANPNSVDAPLPKEVTEPKSVGYQRTPQEEANLAKFDEMQRLANLPPTTQQAVKNLTQRKLKAGSTVVQPLQEADMVVPQATKKTSKRKAKEYPVIDEIANMQYRSKKQMNNISSTFVKPEKETVARGLGTDVKTIQRSLFNSFAPIENRFRKLADKDLMNRGLNAVEAVRKTEAQIQHMIQKGMLDNSGINVVGDSLTSVKNKIESIVDADLWNIYYAHLQNVYRPKGQAVFPRVTAKESQAIVKKIEADHPEILDAREIALNWRNQMDAYDVASGNMSLAEKEAYRESNPFYFPIARVQGTSTKTPYSKKTAELFKVYKTKGGQQDIQPWHVAQENWIRASVGSSKMNDLGNVMEEVLGKSKKTGESYSPETYSMNTSVVEEGDRKFLRYLKDGKQVKAEITPEEYIGLKDFFNPKTKNKWAKKFGKSSRLFKDLTVNWNPIFPLINGPRDFFDAVLNSKDAVKMLTSYPKAFVAAVNSNSPYNKLYHQAGVQRSQFVDRDLADSKNPWIKNTIGRIEEFNSFVEMLPRMAEFVATIDKKIGGKVTSDKLMDNISKDLLQTAGRNAAEVTLNFDKSGLVGKYMNETLFPFFNPALQGFAKTINLFTSPAVEKSYKDYAKLLPKLALWGVLPALANEFFYKDNEAYQKLNARDKNLNFIFMLPNGYAIKIPKGRIQAALSIPAREALDPDKTTPLEVAKSIYGSVGVPNPTSSNIIFPAWGAFVSGKNWMGYDIESQKDAGDAIQERWDSSTSEIGKFLGRFTGDAGLSPKDIDYLIDSYTGFLGDVILPLTTKGYRQGKGNAEDILGRRFLINPTYQNELASKFYNYMDEAEQIGNDNEATDKDKMYFKFLSRYNDELTDLRKQIEEVQLSNAPDKKEQLDSLQEQLNATYDTAINGYENFELFLQDSGADIAFEEAVARNAGGTYKDYAEFFNESKMDYQEAEKAGIPVETYYKAFSEMSTDGNDTISQAEAQAYLDSTNLTTEQKAIMWKQVNSGWKSNPYTGVTTTSGGSKTKSVASAYRSGLATKQVNALKNLTVESPNLSSAEIKAIIKMLSS